MKTRPIIVIPILTQTEFLQFEEKYVSKVISGPRNGTGVVGLLGFRSGMACGLLTGGQAWIIWVSWVSPRAHSWHAARAQRRLWGQPSARPSPKGPGAAVGSQKNGRWSLCLYATPFDVLDSN